MIYVYILVQLLWDPSSHVMVVHDTFKCVVGTLDCVTADDGIILNYDTGRDVEGAVIA